ncbi:hypothetical protein A2970_01120 [Candidatus Roizmanbacteria bacterium RIFCSPLOWO2_01_FULL_44_13]|uniref:UPF0102 protein A2970_01120 n=1 Tax=Candidatus Roizmanbacteria bacterium RIFCSPLOWO2_01_FULL_44_13 TaxID=1802069 RepID=A0A1F7JAC1_9BACT|nr:MAG: hypothetical protein A2970_01120 [Candidatus Roizmanbacteria bacterium RIFCSPLOWO2_01_FULL_44_13]
MSLYRKKTGNQGELDATVYLKGQGFSIIQKNYRTRFGEIDIVAEKNKTLYFIEVKTRSNDSKGKPYESINFYKLTHLKRASDMFLLQNNYKNYKLKLALISILRDRGEISFFDDLEI